MSPFSGSFLAIGRGHCPIQPPADFQEPSFSKLGLRKFSTSWNFLRSQVITTRPTNPFESRHASTVWRLFFESTGLAHSSLAPTRGRTRESLPNTVVGNGRIWVGIFYGRESSRHARPTHLRAATPRRCDGFFSFRIDGSRSLLSRADQWPGERVVAKHRRRKSRNFHFHFHFFSSAFIRPSPANHVTTTSSGLRKIFQFFGLRKFFNFLFFDNLFPI